MTEFFIEARDKLEQTGLFNQIELVNGYKLTCYFKPGLLATSGTYEVVIPAYSEVPILFSFEPLAIEIYRSGINNWGFYNLVHNSVLIPKFVSDGLICLGEKHEIQIQNQLVFANPFYPQALKAAILAPFIAKLNYLKLFK